MGRADTPMKYRLGIDLGTGSLGWAVLELNAEGEPIRIERLGSRIFGTGRKPKDNSSLAADRRQARSVRRRHDRYLQRRNRLLAELTAVDLFPIDLAERAALKKLQPFQLRAEGLERALTPHEFGRALYHLQQRRGFKSNRKADKGDNESSAMKDAIRDFDANIPEGETVGSFLWGEIQEGRGARARHRTEGSKNIYDFYIGREMVDAEFAALWEAQRSHHPSLLTAPVRERVHHAIFDQRPLKPVDPGKCLFEEGEKRASDALVSSQLFRLWQEVNSLRVRDLNDSGLTERPLTRIERDKAIDFLRPERKKTLVALRNVLFGRGSDWEFTHEAGERTDFKGDPVSAALADPRAFGDAWWKLSLDVQDEIARRIDNLEGPDSEHALGLWLMTEHSLDEAAAEYVVNKISLPDGHRRLSTLAIKKILPHLQEGWDAANNKALTYDQAVLAVSADAEARGDIGEAHRYRSHSQRHTGELFDALPYYGAVLRHYTQAVARAEDETVQRNTNPDEWEHGRIANPTVHIGLNQVRTVVNALVARYGPPAQIHVEVARELGQSREKRIEASKFRSEGEKRNNALRESLTATFEQPDNFHNRERLRLWEDLGPLNHKCVITGRTIDRTTLFSNEWQVDHILPFSRTLDDSYSNKMLVHFTANQEKGNNSPFEAFGQSGPRWDEILQRAETGFVRNPPKFRRFGEDAMERYENGEQDFIARQLTDTAYLARASKEYLGSLIDPNNVVTLPGRLTAMIRAKWGLNALLGTGNQKDRSDHRHHAIDAAVIAFTDRSTLKRMTDANRRAEDASKADPDGVAKLLKDFDQPWDGFYRDMENKVAGIVISHRPDHGPEGQLHEETAYGVLEGPDKEGRYLTRKREKDAKTGKVSGFEEPKWRPVIPIFRRGDGPDSALPYKAYIGGSNYCIEIVRLSSGKWAGEVISTFQANTREYQDFMKDKVAFHHSSFSGTPLVMRLVADDTIAIEEDGARRIMRLCKMDSDGPMYFAAHNEGNVAARSLDKSTEFSMLKKNANPLRDLQARRVFVDPLGNVLDPGFTP
jgi:CRISPR-associated endonuclease Csn1